MNTTIRERHWTSISRGPGGLVLLYCSHNGCGLLDGFIEYEDAKAEAAAHVEEAKAALNA